MLKVQLKAAGIYVILIIIFYCLDFILMRNNVNAGHLFLFWSLYLIANWTILFVAIIQIIRYFIFGKSNVEWINFGALFFLITSIVFIVTDESNQRFGLNFWVSFSISMVLYFFIWYFYKSKKTNKKA
jgi:hypothetical protein